MLTAQATAARFEHAAYEEMGPSLLAQQPVNAPDKIRKTDFSWETIFTHLESRLGSLRSWRWSWWVYWSILARFFDPKRYLWLVVANRMWRGSPINDAIIDSTGLLAVRTCSSGMWTGLTSPSRPWFKFGTALPWAPLDADGTAWMEDTEQRVYTVLQQSNFYNIMAQAFTDEVIFGTAPVLVYEDAEDVARFYLPCAGEYYLAVGSRLAVNTIIREYTLTVSQLIEEFTYEGCPHQVTRLWDEGGASLDAEFVVCEAIEPNYAINGRGANKGRSISVVPGIFTYRQVHWLKGIKTNRELSRRGFHTQPFAVFRWSVKSNDAYGRSPCMDELGDNKQIQTETIRKNEYLEKGVRPPMGADPELKNEPSSINPAQITYMSTAGGKKGFWPLFEVRPEWLSGITADIAQVSKRIEKGLYVDLFMAISRMEGVQPRNELELTKRDLERLQELGPVIDLNEGALSILLMRVIDILERRRMLKPKPKSLQNVPLKITYHSIMRVAQRSAEAIGMKDMFSTMGALSSAAKAAGVPDPLRVVDLDKSARHYGELSNFPADCLFTEDEVKQHDMIREKEMAKAKTDAQAPQQMTAAVNAAKTLSDTQLPGGNSALGSLLGQQPAA